MKSSHFTTQTLKLFRAIDNRINKSEILSNSPYQTLFLVRLVICDKLFCDCRILGNWLLTENVFTCFPCGANNVWLSGDGESDKDSVNVGTL